MNIVQALSDKALELLSNYGPKLLMAIVTLIVGLWIIKILVKAFAKGMERSKIEVSLRSFLLSLVRIMLKVMLVISVASMIGLQMTSFVAILGAAGLAVGLALQGSLANFAGGVLILLFKPFKVGDFVDAGGHTGTIKEIQIFNTILKTPDNKTIIIPNGNLSNGSITNFSTEPIRRIDMTFGIGYSDDIQKAKETLEALLKSDSRILDDPAPTVAISELGDSSVNFAVRPWCNSADYWGVYFDIHEKVKLEFDKAEISIPFPQQDVHLYRHEG